MLGYVLAAVVGAALGIVIDLLADWLPTLSSENDPVKKQGMIAEAARSAAEAAQSDLDAAAAQADGEKAASTASTEALEALRRAAEAAQAAADSAQKAWEAAKAAADARAKPRAPGVLSPRGIIVILLMAGLAVYLYAREGLSWTGGIYLAYLALFVLIAVIDFEHLLVLDAVMIPAFIFALLEVFLSQRQPVLRALGGFAAAQIAVMGIYLAGMLYLWIVNTQRETPVTEVPFGFGDVTLASFCGLVIGLGSVILMIPLMIVIGGLMAAGLLLVRGLIQQRYKAHTAIPYGPAILLASAILLLWGEQVMRLLGVD
ncbi:MAG: hypothetical protein Kow00124_22700 [Anaerolineae bacterium]